MNVEELKSIYFSATGLEITDETAEILLDSQKSPWFQKVLKMAEPTKWSDFQGTYSEVKK